MWRGLKEFLTYNKKQRNGLLVLAALALLIQVFLYVDDFFFQLPPQDFTEFEAYARQYNREDSLAQLKSSALPDFFSFDPNTVSEEQMRNLGLSARQITTIAHYRQKGGKFRKPSDLKRIYGIDSAWYMAAVPFIQIAAGGDEYRSDDDKKPSYHFLPFHINKVKKEELAGMGLKDWQAQRIITYREKVRPFETPQELYKVYGLDSSLVKAMLPSVIIDKSEIPAEETVEKLSININEADSLDLLKLTGIGPAYAKRIKEYRERLGGFYRKEQLLEVYGMDEDRYNLFKDQIVVDKRCHPKTGS